VANRQGDPNAELTVNYSTTGGTATSGSDFTAITAGTLTFAAGETQKTITVKVLNDNLIESTENFFVALTSQPGSGVAIGTNGTATVDISDDDSPSATIGFSQSSFDADEGSGFANLTVTRSGGLGVHATVNYSTSDGTALAGTNYVSTTGSVTFAINEVTKTIQIPIIDDPTADPTLTFTVTLTADDGTGFVGGRAQATVNIIDNDATTFRFNPSTYTIDEGSGSVTLTVEALRVGDPSETITVDYVTTDATAKAGSNYTRTSGRLTFGPDISSQTITVPIIENSSTDGTTTFTVTLSNPLGEGDSAPPRLGTPSSATVSIIDNDATTFQFALPSYTANDQAGVANATVTLSRIGDPNTTYSVSYATSDLTAVAGRDYVATSGKLTFGPGVTSQVINVPLIPGPVGEPTRQFRITLSSPTNGAFLGTTSSTIINISNPDLSTKPTNISTRGLVESGDGVMIAGFIIDGSSTKQVIIRGLGPSLTQHGVIGALQDPTLDLRDVGGVQMAFNDDFAETQEAEIAATGLTPTDSRESAIVATLPPGHYTAILRGKTNGIGLVEVYDLESTSGTHLVNISTRAAVGPDDNGALIGGFIVDGQVSQQMLIRALGPSLTDAGVDGALANPTIDFYRGSQLILSNDDWKSDDEAGIKATGIPPAEDKEAAILVTLDPGSYTAVIRGKNNTTGVALVEVYQIK
jgi:Calx-beta domain